MDELPNDLRDMLELARSEHEPPDGAQQRVRIALAAAIGVPTAGAVLSGGKAAAMGSQAPAAIGAKAGWLALGGKLTAAAVGTVAAASIGYAVYTSRAPAPVVAPLAAPIAAPAAAQVEVAPTPQVEPIVAPAAAAEQPAEQADVERTKPRKAATASQDTLSEEMALLRAASEALARSDEEAALVQLNTHAKRFPRGSLREERDGLKAIAECTRDTNPSKAAAVRFTSQHPSSVLAARVSAACK